ncbi:autotransporter outer membrane beta-barrel domain-containing protein [Hyphomicrobium sp. ghe19]|uniref:autotransporter outer membrane beta-barrel domain-containing protein n=1 Tax=Hyphomicrobium sp. ghe19 TaxID=2682968 RepID=UPI0013669309|nr:Extracellular serine protease [Hyphomicrobium sp. ghe19]
MSSANHVLRRPAAQLILASLATALSMGVSQQALAACAGSVASPNSNAITVLCNNASPGSANLTVDDNTTYVDTTTKASGSNVLLQFDGHGRELINNGTVTNDRIINGGTGRNHTAVVMGASTINAGNGTTFNSVTPGATTTTIKLGPTVNTAWVNQSIILGSYDGDDFTAAQSYVIQSVDTVNNTVTVAGVVPSNLNGTGDQRYSIVSNYGATTTVNGVAYNNVIINNGLISSSIKGAEITANQTGASPTITSGSNTGTVKGVTTSVAGTYLIQNNANGTIKATHDGIGTTTAVEAGGQVTSLTIENSGKIIAERTTALTLAAVSATAAPTATEANWPGFSAQNVALVTGVYSEEEAQSITVNNRAGGLIQGKGDYTGALYLRAEEQSITNYGTIEHVSSAGGTDYSKGYAIASVSNGGGIRELEFTNYGTVHGDILSVNGNALRWYALSTSGIGSVDSRLLINSHTGQANSEIENKASGVIIGNFWYSNGEHELENEGKIVGNIDVDQRDTTYGTVSGSVVTVLAGDDDNPGPSNNTSQGTGFTIRGDKTFEFENSGSFTGNLTITNATSTITNGVYGSQTINKTVASDNSIENSGKFDGNILIKDVAGAKNTVTLVDDGFGRKDDGSVNTATGNITATTGAGNNILNLEGTGTLRGDVSKFTTLNLAASEDAGGGDDDDDDDAPAASGGPNWTFAFGKTFEFLSAANIDAGTLNVEGILKTPITNIGEDGTLKGTGTIQGNVLNKGTIDVADKTLHVIGNVTLDDDSKLATTITNSGNGVLAITGHLNADDDATVVANLERVVWSGEEFTIATTTTGITGLPEVAETALLHWDASVVSNNLVITADRVDANDIEGMSKPGASAINALLGFDSELGVALLGVEEEDDVKKAGNQLAPETNFATQQAAIALNSAVGQHIDMRLNAVGATGGAPSFASGPSGLGMKQPSDPNRSNLGGGLKDDDDFVAPRSAALWGQAFGAGLNQNGREQVDGYDARIYGALAGYDNWISPGVRVGVAGGYANTRINGDGDTSQNHTEIDSYLIQAYGAVKGAGWYASARTGFTWNDYDTTRVLTIPFSDKAEGSHDGGQFNASVEIGAPMRFASTILTPVASLTYSRLHQNGYTESSDGGMALNVGSQDNDSLVSGLGLKALVPIANDTVIQGRALWLHEFADDAQNVTASFAAGGGTFAAGGPAVGRDTAGLGVGMLAQISAESTFELNYDANVREDYLAHIGSARIDVHF